MAQKGGYPGYPQQPAPPPANYAPPPYPGQGYPGPQQGATNTVIIQQQQPVVVGKSSRGFLGSMIKEIDKIGHSIGREADRAANAIDRSLQTSATGTVLRGFLGSMIKEMDKIGHSIGREADRAANAIDRSLQTSATGSVLPGLFGQLGRELNVLGKTVSREIDWTANQINKAVATNATGNILNLFQTGNVVQLVSRANGGCLEILQGAAGLIVDGRGPQGAPHATWTVVNEGNNQVRLHNNNNFLAIINGNTIVMSMPQGIMHGVETKFQLSQIGQFIYLESMKERNRYIGILPNGDLKSALATGKEMHSQFGVKLLYSPYSPATVTTVTTKR